MKTHEATKNSINSDVHTQNLCSMQPFLCIISMTISSVITIYRAYNNKDILMILFITYVYIGSFLFDYWSRLYHKLPPSEQSSKRRNVKIGMWVLFSSTMLGFACEFSTFMNFTESLCIFLVVIVGNVLLFYVYFVWKGNKSASACSTHRSCYNNGNAVQEEEYKPLTDSKGVFNV
ncbi:uncharacterized protein LOC133300194 [Gastrolobium bilobum]|uniref:uncharacterized protein LOC133300194 n=1 Tax=Gastrolobium bilobum TaxID=150636 RepID=UPI002AB16F5A|nr:uncharacterized protein LOC133300194 [Gastrolobium bilobum]